MDVLIGWPGGDWQSTLKIVGALVGAYLALIWVTTVLWSYRDIRSRTRDPFSQLIGISLVTALPLIGIPLYLVLRPSGTLQEAYDRQLEQEAILSELHSVSACPECRRPVQDEFMACPHCQTSLKEPCAHCSRLLTHAWRHCPYCGTTREQPRSAARLEFDGSQGEPEQREPQQAAPAPQSREGAEMSPESAPARPRRRSRSATSEESAAP